MNNRNHSVGVYTTVDRDDETTHTITLSIGCQSFDLAYEPKDRECAEWMAKQLEDALRSTQMEKMQKAINDFCYSQDWAREGWKRQPHIEALLKLRTNK